jgi:signal transduction histidine kinase
VHIHDPAARLDPPGTHDEVAALARTLNEMLSRQQTALQQQRQLVADAGHELRSPLAILQAELELAARPGRSREALAAAVANAADETRRLTRLAGNLLLLGQHDDGQPLARPQNQPIAPVLQAAITGATECAAGPPDRCYQ